MLVSSPLFMTLDFAGSVREAFIVGTLASWHWTNS